MANRLLPNEIEASLSQVPEWNYAQDRQELFTSFEFTSFAEAVDFVNTVAEIANALDHHPDIFIFNKVIVQLICTTKDVGGVSDKDFEFARAIDELFKQSLLAQQPVNQPQPELEQQQVAQPSVPQPGQQQQQVPQPTQPPEPPAPSANQQATAPQLPAPAPAQGPAPIQNQQISPGARPVMPPASQG